MPDDPDLIGQNEIQDLLKQAKGAVTPPAHSVPPAGTVQQDEIDSLLNGLQNSAGGASVADTAATATAVASPAQPTSATSQTADDVQVLWDQAEQALASVNDSGASSAGLAAFQFRDFAGTPPSSEKATLDLLRDVELDLKIELGRTQMDLEQVLKLRKGSVVALDKLAGDPVDVYVNGRLVARGEVLVLNDNFCVRVAELVSGSE